MFKDLPIDGESDYLTRSKQWYLKDVEITPQLVKSYIDEFTIVNTTLNVSLFINRLVDWYNVNYPELETKSINTEIFNINDSSVKFENKVYTTDTLKLSLSDKDIEKFLDLNSIDFELYEYVYNLERQ
jgi:hypothetical protein